MIATRENMRLVQERRDVFAYSFNTGERYSANPGDYFWLPDGEPLTDDDGEPLVLACERVQIAVLDEVAV